MESPSNQHRIERATKNDAVRAALVGEPERVVTALLKLIAAPATTKEEAHQILSVAAEDLLRGELHEQDGGHVIEDDQDEIRLQDRRDLRTVLEQLIANDTPTEGITKALGEFKRHADAALEEWQEQTLPKADKP